MSSLVVGGGGGGGLGGRRARMAALSLARGEAPGTRWFVVHFLVVGSGVFFVIGGFGTVPVVSVPAGIAVGVVCGIDSFMGVSVGVDLDFESGSLDGS